LTWPIDRDQIIQRIALTFSRGQPVDSPKRAWRWFRPRISLRALLVAVAVFAAFFANLAMQWRSAKRQEAAVAALAPLGGAWGFDYRLKNYGPDSGSTKQATWVPKWLSELLGQHFFESVRAVSFGNPQGDPNRPKTPDEALEILQEFPGLREFGLLRSEVTDRALDQLKHCPQIHYMDLWANKNITPEAMKYVKKLRRLHTFYSMGTHNSEAGIAHLKELPQLRELLIGDEREESTITNSALKHIGEMKSLQLLSIQSATVTDEGLIYLENLPQLRELTLSNTKVTPEGVKRLQRALPNCEITVR
jgi:hypothetical protein